MKNLKILVVLAAILAAMTAFGQTSDESEVGVPSGAYTSQAEDVRAAPLPTTDDGTKEKIANLQRDIDRLDDQLKAAKKTKNSDIRTKTVRRIINVSKQYRARLSALERLVTKVIQPELRRVRGYASGAVRLSKQNSQDIADLQKRMAALEGGLKSEPQTENGEPLKEESSSTEAEPQATEAPATESATQETQATEPQTDSLKEESQAETSQVNQWFNWTNWLIFGVLVVVGFVAYQVVKSKLKPATGTTSTTEAPATGVPGVDSPAATPQAVTEAPATETGATGTPPTTGVPLVGTPPAATPAAGTTPADGTGTTGTEDNTAT